ncbi:membrane-bound alkaline phosphatase-like [Sipha flava]|uniref:alkaline phosphatase n=1 Tax=Sipha flava TaxID=143950 RepID=A0A8B8FU40_9HEMI|nr:membrane-bound alkaline phosphatase-like [Sipha flava]
MWTFAVCALACGLARVSAAAAVRETESKFWLENGNRMLDMRFKMQLQTNTARNMIMFLGDGMSLTTLTAARIYQGQLRNGSGENERLSFERFPFTGISKTYCVDFQVPDSACTSTAYLCGVKTNKGAIGVSSKVSLFDCPASVSEDARTTSIMQWAQWTGKATGIVTTTRVTHASPAGAYAHVAHRDWESDSDMQRIGRGKTNVTQCEDIARQLITRDPGQNFKVILGGGRSKFLFKESDNSTGERLDENLIDVWKNNKLNRFPGQTTKYVTNREELMNVNASKVDYLLGLFHDSHMDYRLKADANKQPTLQEMTKKAVEVLQKEPNGFVLFVEGGLIDKAHHETWAKIALDETVEFSKAVAAAAEMTDEDDTLIVVTSDHAHTMTMAGYPVRGENILGSPRTLADDNKAYTTLSYANGPKVSFELDNSTNACRRLDVTNEDIAKVDFQYPSLVHLNAETHGGDDVMVFARGPWAHLFTGNFEQNEIPLAMALAANLPTKRPERDSHSLSGAVSRLHSVGLISTSVLVGLLGTFRFGL